MRYLMVMVLVGWLLLFTQGVAFAQTHPDPPVPSGSWQVEGDGTTDYKAKEGALFDKAFGFQTPTSEVRHANLYKLEVIVDDNGNVHIYTRWTVTVRIGGNDKRYEVREHITTDHYTATIFRDTPELPVTSLTLMSLALSGSFIKLRTRLRNQKACQASS